MIDTDEHFRVAINQQLKEELILNSSAITDKVLKEEVEKSGGSYCKWRALALLGGENCFRQVLDNKDKAIRSQHKLKKSQEGERRHTFSNFSR